MLLSSLAFLDRFEILEQIKFAPRVYALTVKEVVRRRDFASQYVKVKFVFKICYLHFCLLICCLLICCQYSRRMILIDCLLACLLACLLERFTFLWGYH